VISRLLLASKIIRNEANLISHQNTSEALQFTCPYVNDSCLWDPHGFISKNMHTGSLSSRAKLADLHSRSVSESKKSSGFCAELLSCGRRMILAKDSVVTSDVERV
jgi:hypothetical protein